MSTISAIDTLEAIVDGDTIVPGMSYSSPKGVGLIQFYNPQTNEVSPKFKNNNITFYPTCYSSNQGRYLAPDSGTEQWYFGNPDVEANEILIAAGATTVKSAYADKFKVGTYTSSGVTYPALVLIGELADKENRSDVSLYFKAEFNGIAVTAHAEITIKTTVGDNVDILIQCNSVDSNGNVQDQDTVLDFDGESLLLTAYLLNNGDMRELDTGWVWYRMVDGALKKVENVSGVTELSENTLRLYDAAIEGTEEYFAEYTSDDGQKYRAGIQVSDIHDPYYIAIGRSTNSNLIRQTDTVLYTPHVINRSTGIVEAESNWTFDFTLLDTKGNPIDQDRTVSSQVLGTTVATYGQVIMQITAKKN